MKFWKNSERNFSKAETEKAEMLEIYTRWIRGEKLSRKQTRLLKASQEYPELEPLKQLIDFAHYRFREKEIVTPLPGSKQRVAGEVMREINRAAVEDTALSLDEPALQPSYSPDPVGSDSELALPPVSGDLPPPPQIADLFSETVILNSENIEGLTSPLVEGTCSLKLRIVQGDEAGREYNIAFLPVIIGHGVEATIPLNANAAVSRHHALLTVNGDEVSITDLGSSSGTYVDGVRITEPTPLYLTSKVKIGEQSLEVVEIQQDTGVLRISFKEIEGSNVGKICAVDLKEMTVGRGTATRIKFADPTDTLSRLHARFDLKDSEVYVTDLGSKNGTYVDGVRIEGPTIIQNGTIIKFSSVICEVVDIEHT